jgi:glucan biosynthesis protein C
MDHFRWGVIVLVVTLHAAVTYSGIGGWYYHEPAELDAASRVVFLAYELHLQAFFMGLLFFVAGYFVPGAYDRKGARRFLLDRVTRLGVPTAFYALVIEPLIFYLVLHHKGQPAPPFWQAYPNYLVTLQVLSGTGPLWFTLALLLFTAAYTGVRVLRGSGTPEPVMDRSPTHAGVIGFIGTVTAVTFLVRIVQPIGTDVLNLQLCFFPQYIALFVLGTWAYRGDWLSRIPRAFGLFWLRPALILGPLLWLGVLVGGRIWSGDFSTVVGGLHWQSGAYCLWESFFCAGVCLGLLVLVRDRFNRHTVWTRFLADNAFAVYVFHAPILIGLTFALHRVAWPPLAKFAGLSVAALVVCFAASHLVLRRVPGLRRML